MKTLSTILATLVLLLTLSLPAMSAEKAGVALLDSQMVGDQQVVLNGIALREKFVFDVYVAGLYVVEKSNNPEAIFAADAPRVMVMHFLRDVGADKMNEAWVEGVEANVPDASTELKGKIDQVTTMMEDIKDDQTMGFIYTPGTGTQVMVNGKDKGTIPGKDFADAILATWIGPKPGPGKKFKAALLGQ